MNMSARANKPWILWPDSGVEDIAAVGRHFTEDAPSEVAHFLRAAIAQQHIRNAAAEGEPIMQPAVNSATNGRMGTQSGFSLRIAVT
jgi:hypothetical protein